LAIPEAARRKRQPRLRPADLPVLVPLENSTPKATARVSSAAKPADVITQSVRLDGLQAPRAVAALSAGAIAADRPLFPEGDAPVGGLLKRVIDVTLASIGLLVASPLLLVVAVLVRANMGGPVVFRQKRVGYGGKTFHCLKFRTMVSNAETILEEYLARDPALRREWEANRKLVDDPRTTALGRLLRKSSLDELPQLLNVLRGEMSLVGPRPVVEAELRKYGRQKASYLKARPGVTGLWQVSGRSTLSYDSRVALDALYVRKCSLGLDLKILLKTLPALLSPHETS